MISEKTNSRIFTIISYGMLFVYATAAVIFMISLITTHLFPVLYLVIIALALAIVGVVLTFLQGHSHVLSIIGSALFLALAVLLIIASTFMRTFNVVVEEVTTPTAIRTDVIAVYVLRDDPAESIEDARDYQFGIIGGQVDSHIRETIVNINELLEDSIQLQEYEDAIAMLASLREGRSQAIIVDEAYVRIFGSVEGFEWIYTELRALKMEVFEVEIPNLVYSPELMPPELIPPEEVPDSFVIYLSGIDTYGGVTARSRSDVNIIVVVNTVDKRILILSTPRDAVVTFPVTGGATDKLTHAGIYGVDQSMAAVANLYGLEIDYFLRLNFTGFMDIVDALGGVNVYSEFGFTVYPIRTFTPGWNHLSGIEALAFARERGAFAEGDIQRGRNQMELIRALIMEAASPALLINFNQTMNAVSGSFETNMPRDHITQLIRMQLSDMAEWTIVTYSTIGYSALAPTFSIPGHNVFVMNLTQASIEEARRLIAETMGIVE